MGRVSCRRVGRGRARPGGRSRGRRDAALSPVAWAWPLAAALAFSPLVYPWYLVWLLPFLTSAAALPLTVWSLSILPTYGVWHWFAGGSPWRGPLRC